MFVHCCGFESAESYLLMQILRSATQRNRCVWHLQGSENEVSHAGLGNKAWGEKKVCQVSPSPRPWRAEGQTEKEILAATANHKVRAAVWFWTKLTTIFVIRVLSAQGQSHIYLKIRFFFPPLRWGINKLSRNPNSSRITKENQRNVLRTGEKVFRPPLCQELCLLPICKRRLVTITEKILVTKRFFNTKKKGIIRSSC